MEIQTVLKFWRTSNNGFLSLHVHEHNLHITWSLWQIQNLDTQKLTWHIDSSLSWFLKYMHIILNDTFVVKQYYTELTVFMYVAWIMCMDINAFMFHPIIAFQW